MNLLIVDPETYKPYSVQDLEGGGLGGTEATVIRLAEALGATVLQHNRVEASGRYLPMDAGASPTHIMVVRDTLQAIRQAQSHPAAKTYLWLHDLAGPDTPRGKLLRDSASRLAQLCVSLVCVSDFQAADVRRNFAGLAAQHTPDIKRVYNPVVVGDDIGISSAYDPDKLVFFSSRQKGLDYTLEVFAYLHSRNRSLRLFLANPGYYASQENEIPGVVNLGSLPHAQIVSHVRSSLCTFYPNYTFPETFGLVMAESNAVGTPVLAHPIGAAREILCGDGQLMPVPRLRMLSDRVLTRFPSVNGVRNKIFSSIGMLRCYENRINEWRSGRRPNVFSRQEFSLSSVVAAWRQVFFAA